MGNKNLIDVVLGLGLGTGYVLSPSGRVRAGALTGQVPGPWPGSALSVPIGTDVAAQESAWWETLFGPGMTAAAKSAIGPGTSSEQTPGKIPDAWMTANGLEPGPGWAGVTPNVSTVAQGGPGGGVDVAVYLAIVESCRDFTNALGLTHDVTPGDELAAEPLVDWRIAGGTATGMTLEAWIAAHMVAGVYVSPYFDASGNRLPVTTSPHAPVQGPSAKVVDAAVTAHWNTLWPTVRGSIIASHGVVNPSIRTAFYNSIYSLLHAAAQTGLLTESGAIEA
jgi:hypothetical protein